MAPQALYLMNSPFIHKQSKEMAQDLMRQHPGKSAADLARVAFQRILSRQADEREERLLSAYLRAVSPAALPEQLGRWCHALWASTQYEFLD